MINWYNRSFFSKLVFSITMFSILIISISSFVLYQFYGKAAQKIINESNTNMLSQVSYSANYMDDAAKNFALSLFLDNPTLELMYGDSINFEDSILKMQRVSKTVDLVSFVQSVYIYNNTLQAYFTTWKTPTVIKKDSFFDRNIVDIMDSITDKQKAVPILRKIPVDDSIDNKQYIYVYTYIIYDTPQGDHQARGAVIVNIKASYLRDLIISMNNKPVVSGTDIFIIDHSGNIINTTNDDYLKKDATTQSVISTIVSSPEESGFFLKRINNQQSIISYVSSDHLGWKFVKIVPYGQLTKQLDAMKVTTILIGVALLIIGSFVSFYLSKYLYTPIRRLVNKVTQISKPLGDIKKMDEVSYLSAVFMDSYENTQSLETIKRDNIHHKKSEWLKNLLLNEQYMSINFEEMRKEYGFIFNTNSRFIIYILKIDRYNDFVKNFNTIDRGLLRYSIGNIAGELTKNAYTNEFVDMGEDHIAVIVNIPNEAQEYTVTEISRIVNEVQHWAMYYLKLSLSAAISYTTNDFFSLNRSYIETLNIIKYRLVYGHQAVLSPENLTEEYGEEGFSPPFDLENQLIQYLIGGKESESRECYEQIIIHITHYSYETIISYLFYLASLLYHKLNVIEIRGPYQFKMDLSNFTRKIDELETMEQINLLYFDLFRRVVEQVLETKSTSNIVVVSTVEKIINANYTDKSLCLEGIAKTINMSKNYIGKMFRDVHGISVADYIMDYRLNKAAELIESGQHNIDKILTAVGLDNKNYFYKLFKNKFDLTFSDYKLKYIQEIQEKL